MTPTVVSIARSLSERRPRIVAIGGSAGAIDALFALLGPVPAELSAPVVITVHIPPDGRSLLGQVLDGRLALSVGEAHDKLLAQAGHVYVAPPDYHLLAERHGTLALSSDARVNLSRPSVDVMFDSIASSYGADALGILLTGANADGAVGLLRMRERGAITWVQSPNSAYARAMPDAALALYPHTTATPAEFGEALAAWARQTGAPR